MSNKVQFFMRSSQPPSYLLSLNPCSKNPIGPRHHFHSEFYRLDIPFLNPLIIAFPGVEQRDCHLTLYVDKEKTQLSKSIVDPLQLIMSSYFHSAFTQHRSIVSVAQHQAPETAGTTARQQSRFDF